MTQLQQLTHKDLHLAVSIEVSHQRLALDLTHLHRPPRPRVALHTALHDTDTHSMVCQQPV
jgi:hypothetical protein